MNRQQKRLILVVLAFAAVVYILQSQRRQEPTPSPASVTAASVAPPVEVQNALFAKRRIEKNTKMDQRKVLELIELRNDLPKTELPKEKLATTFQELSGRIALDEIQKGEPIVLSRFAWPEEIGGVSHHIKEGYRAVTLRIDKIRGVGGFIQQGDVVDIIGSFRAEGRGLTKYVLQNVKILAVNQEFKARVSHPETPGASPEPSPAPSPAASPAAQDQAGRDKIVGGDVQLVTFEVRPQEVERLIVASEHANLYMVLRNPADPDMSPVPPVDAVDVYIERPKKPPVPKYDVDVMKGQLRSAVGVRLQSTPSTELTTSVRKSMYMVDLEPTIRDLRNEDRVRTPSAR